MADDTVRVRRALVSVSDKGGLEPFATGLVEAGVALVSTGSTAETLRGAGLEVTAVADVTGFPEMLEGRVKTLHPAIHAGILADRAKADHLRQLAGHGFEPIDLVVVNLYPFERTVAATEDPGEIIEQIDIGGPTLIRAAAKNFMGVAVVVRPERYDDVLTELRDGGGISGRLRSILAAEAFAHVATYDAAIAEWFRPRLYEQGMPTSLTLGLERLEELRYGENPHQAAALYRRVLSPGPFGGAEVLQGKEMSFNNWLDAEAARDLAAAFEPPCAVIVKHNNPCGTAVADSLAEAYGRAFASDEVSAFGGVVAFNSEVDEAAARRMGEVFTEVVVAPSYDPAALAFLAEKKNLRVVRAPLPKRGGLEIRPIDGGALVQDVDVVVETRPDMQVVTRREPTEDEWWDLLFAWTVAARVKSNAIVFARDGATVGVGAGQMSRVDSVDIAARKAGPRAEGAVMASDAFFPFRDGIDRAAQAGIRAVIQPGGSVRDAEVIQAAEEAGMAMVATGRRHFRH